MVKHTQNLSPFLFLEHTSYQRIAWYHSRQVTNAGSESRHRQPKRRFHTEDGVIPLEFRGRTSGTSRARQRFRLALPRIAGRD